MRRNARRGVDVDITPLIDVLFMLIIFFVLTAVFVQGAIEVDLPKGDAEPVSERNPVIVTVTRDSGILWAGEAVTLEEMPKLVEKVLAGSDDVLIAGDRDASYGDVAKLLDRLRELGVANVGLAFEGESTPQ
jgi:biopolymer transport protein ExbD